MIIRNGEILSNVQLWNDDEQEIFERMKGRIERGDKFIYESWGYIGSNRTTNYIIFEDEYFLFDEILTATDEKMYIVFRTPSEEEAWELEREQRWAFRD